MPKLTVVVPLLLWLSLVSFIGPANAAVSGCNSNNGNPVSTFDGAEIPSQVSTFGVRADIEYQNADLCGQKEIFSVTWVMITAHNPHTGGPGWVQTGYGDFNDYSSHNGAWSWGQSVSGCDASLATCQDFKNSWGDTLTGDTPKWTYSARFYASDDFGHMIVNGIEIGHTTWDMTNAWDGSWQGQFEGETKYSQSDVSGTPDDHTSFTNLQRLSYPAGSASWSDITGLNTPQGDICRYKAETITSGQSFRIWTQPLLSLC